MRDVSRVLADLGLGPTEPLLGFGDATIQGFPVDGAKAVEVWSVLRRSLPALGHWPLIIGDGEAVEILRENWEITAPPSEAILAQAAELGVEAWLGRRCQRDEEYYEEPHGTWLELPEPPTSFGIPIDILTGLPLAKVYVAVVPTSRSWEVPGYVHFGGWNECPFPHEHVAVLRYWQQKFGSEIVGLSHSTIECAVAHPPLSKTAAIKLARQQFVYCADIVWQGVRTIENLGATLLKSPVWYFWWD